MTLSGSGSLKLIKMTPEGTHVKPLIGTDGVAIAAPELGWYATAVAGSFSNGSNARGIPGSAVSYTHLVTEMRTFPFSTVWQRETVLSAPA